MSRTLLTLQAGPVTLNTLPDEAVPWSRADFEAQLKVKGERYHIHHPYQVMMDRGELDQEQIRGWVANRFYYQVSIPLKDANLLAHCPDRDVRRRWIQRIIDHDGGQDGEGGIEAWITLGEACGLSREEILSQQRVLPGVRFAVDAYVNFVRQATWQEGVCSSLTELFAPTIHKQRLSHWPDRYPWIDSRGLQYFRNRLTEAHRDVEHGLELVLHYFTTREQQNRALEILQFKLDVLWSMLDAMYMAYVLKMEPYHNVEKST